MRAPIAAENDLATVLYRCLLALATIGVLVGGRVHARDFARGLARRAIDAHPWAEPTYAEPAYGVFVAIAIARGDRAAVRRLLDRGHAIIAMSVVESPPISAANAAASSPDDQLPAA